MTILWLFLCLRVEHHLLKDYVVTEDFTTDSTDVLWFWVLLTWSEAGSLLRISQKKRKIIYRWMGVCCFKGFSESPSSQKGREGASPLLGTLLKRCLSPGSWLGLQVMPASVFYNMEVARSKPKTHMLFLPGGNSGSCLIGRKDSVLSCLPGSVVHCKHKHVRCIENLEEKCLHEREAKPCPPFREKIIALPICC